MLLRFVACWLAWKIKNEVKRYTGSWFAEQVEVCFPCFGYILAGTCHHSRSQANKSLALNTDLLASWADLFGKANLNWSLESSRKISHFQFLQLGIMEQEPVCTSTKERGYCFSRDWKHGGLQMDKQTLDLLDSEIRVKTLETIPLRASNSACKKQGSCCEELNACNHFRHHVWWRAGKCSYTICRITAKYHTKLRIRINFSMRYFPDDSYHATCNMDTFVWGLGSQSNNAHWPHFVTCKEISRETVPACSSKFLDLV